jgi:DNA-binding NarL/FixJ family response regulator
MINIQIVDDHKLLVEGLCRIINESGIAEISAIYHDLNTCRLGLASACPEVLLLDISLPDGNGVDFCAEIKPLYPDLKIMMLTSYSEFNIAKRSLLNGALGYVLKNAMSEELIAGIEAVSNGETFLCEEIDVLMKKKKKDDLIWLTSREREVLREIADGNTDPEIAEKLFLARDTINGYRKDLLLKFGAKNSVVLVKTAIEQKYI